MIHSGSRGLGHQVATGKISIDYSVVYLTNPSVKEFIKIIFHRHFIKTP